MPILLRCTEEHTSQTTSDVKMLRGAYEHSNSFWELHGLLQILNDVDIVIGEVPCNAIEHAFQPVLIYFLSQLDSVALSKGQLRVVLSIKVIQSNTMWLQLLSPPGRLFWWGGRWDVRGASVDVVMVAVLVTHAACWREGDSGEFMLWSCLRLVYVVGQSGLEAL